MSIKLILDVWLWVLNAPLVSDNAGFMQMSTFLDLDGVKILGDSPFKLLQIHIHM